MGTLLVKVHPVDVEIIDDDRVAAAVKRNGQFEPQSLKAWGEICQGGKAKLALDVGSYGGLFGIAAKLMKNDVIAFEPKPIMVRRTKANQALNGVEYDVIQAGASDKDGKAMLGFNADLALTSGSSLEMKGNARMEVKTVTIDGMKLANVGAIKIDVEGHEAAVIRGAMNTIAQFKPWMIVEVLSDVKRKNEVLDLLKDTHKVNAVLDGRNLLLGPR